MMVDVDIEILRRCDNFTILCAAYSAAYRIHDLPIVLFHEAFVVEIMMNIRIASLTEKIVKVA